MDRGVWQATVLGVTRVGLSDLSETDYSTSDSSVPHYPPEFVQIHVH